MPYEESECTFLRFESAAAETKLVVFCSVIVCSLVGMSVWRNFDRVP
jgi:hypothetical protein